MTQTKHNNPLSQFNRISMLFDVYGPLLPQKQRNTIGWYYQDDLSIVEIAAQEKITRQAVSDALHHGISALEDYEKKLELVKRLTQYKEYHGHFFNKLEEYFRDELSHHPLTDTTRDFMELTQKTRKDSQELYFPYV